MSDYAHVLLVDDEPAMRALLRRMLEPGGYDVREAADSHSALASIKTSPPAVAVCDIHMPGPDGVWLANQIRAVSPGTAIILATSDDAIPPTESFRRGTVAYVVKPIARHALLRAVADGFRWCAQQTGAPLPAVVVSGTEREAATPVPPPDEELRSSTVPPAPRTVTPLRAVAAAVLVAVAAAGVYATRSRSPQDTLSRIVSASGVITGQDGAGNTMTQGSGFFVAPSLFVTDLHVIRGATKAQIDLADGGAIAVVGVVGFDRVHDLVLLRSARDANGVLDVETSPVHLGDEVLVYGAPLGFRGTLSKGMVSAEPDDAHDLQISAPISPGSSGSPVINSRGVVVGVVRAFRNDGQSVNFATRAANVEALLKRQERTQPLIAAARGVGDDRERYQLIGPVRLAVVYATPSSADAEGRIANGFGAARTIEATDRLATVAALKQSKTTLIFDRAGRLLEKTLGDDRTITRYEYDADGFLRAIRDFEVDQIVTKWDFVSIRSGVMKAVAASGATRVIEYSADGRMLSDDIRSSRQNTRIEWHYDPIKWPEQGVAGVSEVGSNSPGSEYDPLGNVTKVGGNRVSFEYRFDTHGNWISRDKVDLSGDSRVLIGQDRRTIEYW